MTDVWFGFANPFLVKHPVNTALSPKQLGLFLLLGGAVMSLFAYFYFQEWVQNRRMRQLTELARLRAARAQATAKPAEPRLPLIRVRASKHAGMPEHPQAPETTPAAPLSASTATASRRGRLEICADDAVCEIFLDGAFVGHPPARLTVPEGEHVVEVKHPSGSEYRRSIFVSEGADLRLQAVLEADGQAERRG